MVRCAVYASPAHRLFDQEKVSLADLQLEKQYIVENHYLANLQASVISPHYHLVSSTEVLMTLLKNQGWALLPEQTAQLYEQVGYIKRLEVNELINTVNFNICTFHSPAMEDHPIVKALLSAVKAYARKYLK